MYAQFNPGRDEGRLRAAERHLRRGRSPAGAITRLTRDGSDLVINGGSDWVNEEELDLHDCFRWSPDGTRIAFWQFDLHGVGNFPLHVLPGQGARDRHQIPYPTAGPYPVIDERAVSARRHDELRGARRRRRDVGARAVQLAAAAGRSAAALHRADAVGRRATRCWSSSSIACRTIDCVPARRRPRPGIGARDVARPRTRRSSPSASAGCRRRGRSSGGAEFLVVSEKDGWMHVYRVDARRQGETLVTRGAHRRDGRSPASTRRADSLYFIASPRTPRSATCTAPRSTARLIPCASRR